MRTLQVAAIIAVSALTAFSGVTAAQNDRAEFQLYRDKLQKWKEGMPAPTSLKEAGLLDDAKVVWTGSYLDGGTRGYLLKDSAGNYFAFCTGPGFQTKESRPWIDAPVGSRILIGALHYTRDGAVLVEKGSKCEDFLRGLAENVEAREKWLLTPPKKPVTDTSALTGSQRS